MVTAVTLAAERVPLNSIAVDYDPATSVILNARRLLLQCPFALFPSSCAFHAADLPAAQQVHCVQQRKAAAESEAASGADWCAQGTGIVAAMETQHKSLAHELDELTETGEIHWKRLGQMGGVALGVGAVALYLTGWGAPADGEPSLAAQACAYADSAQSFFSLHFIQPLRNIVSELRPQGLG